MRSVARAILVAGALVPAGCAPDRVAAPIAPAAARVDATVAPLHTALLAAPEQLAVPTYEGSGEVVHPDVVVFPEAWRGSRYWLTLTPYPRSDSKVENPSIYVSDDGRRIETPDGLRNPIFPHAGRSRDYNSDPELLYEPETDRLVLFYRFVDESRNTIKIASSADGRTWTRARTTLVARSHMAVSPTVAPRTVTAGARMWYVDAGSAGCRTTATRVLTRAARDPQSKLTSVAWGRESATDLAQPGYVVWHLKVRYVESKGEYWALYAAFPQGQAAGCDVDDLFFARSVDGVHWQTFPQPVLRHEDRAWTATAVYRSSFIYEPGTDELRVWLSARGHDGRWGLGLARFSYERLLTAISDTTPSARRPIEPTVPPPALPSGDAP